MKDQSSETGIHSPFSLAWKKFRKNKLAMAGLLVIFVALIVVAGGPLLRPDSSPKANDQQLRLALKQPGFSVMMLKLPKYDQEPSQGIFSKWMDGAEQRFTEIPIHHYSFEDNYLEIEEFTGFRNNEGSIRRFKLEEVLGVTVANTEGDLFEIKHPSGEEERVSQSELRDRIVKDRIFNKTFLLGTDKYGRDLLSRLMSGTAISFSVGFISVSISILLGVLLGSIAAYYRGWLDQLIMWFINVVWSIPTLLLVIAITMVLGKGYWQVFVAVGLTMWVEVARVIRGQILGIREKEFVEAARVLGYSDSRIIMRHIIPNAINPVIVISAANFASAILIEAGLSFLGLGAQPPQATWGRMISEHKGYIVTGDAYLAIIPGLAIMLLVLAFMLIGNGLRDALDTRSTVQAEG